MTRALLLALACALPASAARSGGGKAGPPAFSPRAPRLPAPATALPLFFPPSAPSAPPGAPAREAPKIKAAFPSAIAQARSLTPPAAPHEAAAAERTFRAVYGGEKRATDAEAVDASAIPASPSLPYARLFRRAPVPASEPLLRRAVDGAVDRAYEALRGTANGAAGLLGLTRPFGGANAAPRLAPEEVGALPGRDRTSEYLGALAREEADSRGLLYKLSGHRVIFVGGFLSTHLSAAAKLLDPTRIFRLGAYYDESERWLSEAGIPNERVAIAAAGGLYPNANRIAAAIAASPEPVILVTHSKGGLDVLEALIEIPGLRAKVRGWIAVQAPFFGSPVADAVLKKGFWSALSRLALTIMGGNPEVPVLLSEAGRARYMEGNAPRVARLAREVPILSVATWKEPEEFVLDSWLKLVRDSLLERGIRSDGLVPLRSAVLPGSDFVALHGVDHLIPFVPSRLLPFDRPAFLRALLALVLK